MTSSLLARSLCPYCLIPPSSHLSLLSHHCSISVSDTALHSTQHITHFPFLLLRRQTGTGPPTLLHLHVLKHNPPIFSNVSSQTNLLNQHDRLILDTYPLPDQLALLVNQRHCLSHLHWYVFIIIIFSTTLL